MAAPSSSKTYGFVSWKHSEMSDAYVRRSMNVHDARAKSRAIQPARSESEAVRIPCVCGITICTSVCVQAAVLAAYFPRSETRITGVAVVSVFFVIILLSSLSSLAVNVADLIIYDYYSCLYFCVHHLSLIAPIAFAGLHSIRQRLPKCKVTA